LETFPDKISFDRQGNYCFVIEKGDQDYFVTNKDTIGGFKFIGSTYGNGGEINYTVQDAPTILKRIQAHFSSENPILDTTDGLSLEFAQWRMNIRSSNTEPLLRLNIESRGDSELVWQKVAEVESLIHA